MFVTVDLEDFQHATLRRYGGVSTTDAEGLTRGTDRILNAISQSSSTSSKLTFFATGQVARDMPDYIASLAKEGHEVGCHLLDHEHIRRELDCDSFRRRLRQATAYISDATGHPVSGFRAPYLSLDADMPWAFQVLKDEGYKYDSSLKRDLRQPSHTSYPGQELVRQLDLSELPILEKKLWLGKVRVIGGTYFRLVPEVTIINLIKQSLSNGHTPIIYLHPSDFDTQHATLRPSSLNALSPSQKVHWELRKRVWTTGVKQSLDKLKRVLQEFSHEGRLDEYLLTKGQL